MFKNTKFWPSIPLSFLVAVFIFTACDNSTGTKPPESDVQVYTVKDLPANADAERGDPPDFTFFTLRNNEIIADTDSASTKWDIAFSATTILVNNGTSGPGQGGAIVLDVPFNEVNIAPSEGYRIDTESGYAIPIGSDNGWYHYTGEGNPPRAIIPIDNTTIVIRTADGGHYAKIKILSYYKGNPDVTSDEFANPATRPPARYYTFKFAIQKNGTRNFN